MKRGKLRRKKRPTYDIKKILPAVGVLLGIIVAVVLVCGHLKGLRNTNETESESDSGFEIYERVDAPYEHWLAAAVITGISCEYPDFKMEEIWIAEENTLSHSKESSGIYMIFTAEGEKKCVYSVPLEKERTEAGTSDVKSTVIGYATFDIVSTDEIDTSKFKKTEIKDLNTLIEQSEIVTLYSR